MFSYLGLAIINSLVTQEHLVLAIVAGLKVKRVSLLVEMTRGNDAVEVQVPWLIGYGHTCLTVEQVRNAPRPVLPEDELWLHKHIGEEDELRGEADLDWLSDHEYDE